MKTFKVNFLRNTLSVIMWALVAVTAANAHSARETHTVIRNEAGQTVLRVDLPWTVNESARIYYQIPDGEQTSDAETTRYLVSYIYDHLVLYDGKKRMKPVALIQLPQDHGHSLVYELQYDEIQLEKVKMKNTLLMTLNGARQKNVVRVMYADDSASLGYARLSDGWVEWGIRDEPVMGGGLSTIWVVGLMGILMVGVVGMRRIMNYVPPLRSG